MCAAPQVLGDPDRLRGILLNLYTNAAKFTKRGAISLRVSVTGPNYKCVRVPASQRAGAAASTDAITHGPRQCILALLV